MWEKEQVREKNKIILPIIFDGSSVSSNMTKDNRVRRHENAACDGDPKSGICAALTYRIWKIV
jgi:hypothetical protein